MRFSLSPIKLLGTNTEIGNNERDEDEEEGEQGEEEEEAIELERGKVSW